MNTVLATNALTSSPFPTVFAAGIIAAGCLAYLLVLTVHRWHLWAAVPVVGWRILRACAVWAGKWAGEWFARVSGRLGESNEAVRS